MPSWWNSSLNYRLDLSAGTLHMCPPVCSWTCPFGHRVCMVLSNFVAPCRMRGKGCKNEAADAAAICEAVPRPNMRIDPERTIGQLPRLLVLRARQGFVEQRSQCSVRSGTGPY